MKETISILGCGWLGKTLAISLTKNGYQVKGSTTSVNKINELKSIGITPISIDISQRGIDWSDFLNSDFLIIAITSKQSDDFERLIKKIEKSEVRKIIFISSTSVYPNTNNIVTEDSTIKVSELSNVENLFKINDVLDTTVIRFGGLFGYDRQPGDFFKDNKIIQNPEGYINFIHRDDCIGIIEQLISQGIGNITLNACSDSHPKRRAFYTNAFRKLGKPEPVFNEESLNDYKIINSNRLKTVLDYTFKYSDLMNY